ncbi:hypothetical protein [Methylosinus sporium]|uniref:hypothetical protein n=1 Tax=Methylosinus sporium TaxID=428 RepID=UPI00383ADC01
MAKRVAFSGKHLALAETALHHNDTEAALTLFYSPTAPSYSIRFAGERPDEVRSELGYRKAELDRNTTLNLLAAVEAAFRIDYLQRCYLKKKDDVSRQFREIYKEKEARASLEDDIFEVWKNNTLGSAKLIGELRGAFKFRHWMAHGRYWTPKFGQKYDYLSVYPLAASALTSFPLIPVSSESDGVDE